MGKKGEMYRVLIYNQPTLAIAMAAQQFDLLIMMMESPLGRMDYTLGRDVNSCIRSNNMTNIVMHSVGSGWGEQWHCFWAVDDLPHAKPILFVGLYRELNRWMGEIPVF